MRWVLLTLVCACAGHAAAPADPPVSEFVLGISPYLDKAVKDDVYRGLVRLLVQDLPLSSTLMVYDAFELKTISRITVPNQRAFQSPKTRANQFASAIGELKVFLAQDHPKPAPSKLSFESAIRLPQFLDFLAANRHLKRPEVLLIGSPLYQDAKEPAFSMIDGYLPSDGHLRASREDSVFGRTAGAPAFSPPLSLHWVYFGDPWINDLHQEKVTRFWTLYLGLRGARLAVFTRDLPTALESFRRVSPSEQAPKNELTDATQTKIEMLRVSRNIETADWITSDTVSAPAQAAPTTMIGPLKIGIRWAAPVDLDLYAAPRPGADTLFFQHLRSAEGYYYKDHRSSPGREFEFIEFETPVDIREVEAFVNFYKGSSPGGAGGELRVEFEGKIYSAGFAIPAVEGNSGRTGVSQQDFWVHLPLQHVLKIGSSQRAGK